MLRYYEYRPEIIDDMLDLLPTFAGTIGVSTIARCWSWSARSLRYYIESGLLEAVPMPGKKRSVGIYKTTRPAIERFLTELIKNGGKVGNQLIKKSVTIAYEKD